LFCSLSSIRVCRRLSSVGVCNTPRVPAGGFTHAGQTMTSRRLQSIYSSTVTLHGGPVVLRPVKATPCVISYCNATASVDGFRECPVLFCADVTTEYISVEFGDEPSSAVLMSDVLTPATFEPTSACLSLQSVSSTDVNVTVTLSPSPQNLSTSSQIDVTHSRHDGRYWQQTVVVNAGERLFVNATKFRATQPAGRSAALMSNISLTRGNCSSDTAEGAFN